MKKIDFGPAPNLPSNIVFGPAPKMENTVFGPAPNVSNIVFGPAPNFNWGVPYEDEPVVRLRTSVKKRDIRAIDEPFQPSILQNESVVVE